jgi:hypothetical protein
MPLLVDENIHYRICRLLYSTTYANRDTPGYLHKIPLLYGVWHAYKHTVTVVYRAFHPLLGLLECSGEPQSGTRLKRHRKVLFMEKMMALLLLCRHTVQNELLGALQVWEQTDPDELNTGSQAGPSQVDAPGQPGVMVAYLRGMQSLLFTYAPALLHLGFLVRQCTWEGRPGQRATGLQAERVLQYSLLIQTHVQQDWAARQEYTRTLAVALALWQPWMTALPGCCFVEESGEALLSRMARRCRAHMQLTGFASTLRLFLTLPPPSRAEHHLRGRLRSDLVALMTSRLQALIARHGHFPFPHMTGAVDGTWAAQSPNGFQFPGPWDRHQSRDRWQALVRAAVGMMTAPRNDPPVVRDWVTNRTNPLPDSDAVRVTMAKNMLREWRGCRSQLLQSWPSQVTTRRRMAEAGPSVGNPTDLDMAHLSQADVASSSSSSEAYLYEYEAEELDPPSEGIPSAVSSDDLGSMGELEDGGVGGVLDSDDRM